jgi:hypothetical protein
MVQRLIVDEASHVCKVSVIGYVECRRIKNNNFGSRTRATQCVCYSLRKKKLEESTTVGVLADKDPCDIDMEKV